MIRLPYNNSQSSKTASADVDSYEFVDPEDDTPDDRAVVAIVEERRVNDCVRDRDLDDVIAELGFEPAGFLQR